MLILSLLNCFLTKSLGKKKQTEQITALVSVTFQYAHTARKGINTFWDLIPCGFCLQTVSAMAAESTFFKAEVRSQRELQILCRNQHLTHSILSLRVESRQTTAPHIHKPTPPRENVQFQNLILWSTWSVTHTFCFPLHSQLMLRQKNEECTDSQLSLRQMKNLT